MQSLLLLLGAFFLFPASTLAQTGETLSEKQPQAVISGPLDIAVGRTIVLDAGASTSLGEKTTYTWYRGDSPFPISRTLEAVYTPEEPGLLTFRLVVRTEIEGEALELSATRDVIVYTRKIVLIADATIPVEKLALHEEAARETGTYLRVLKPEIPALPITTEESLFTLIKENVSMLAGAESIVLWTDGIQGLQALMRSLEGNEERLQSLKNQSIMLIASRGLQTLGRTARGPFGVLHPDRIIVTRKEAVNPLIEAKTFEGFLVTLDQRDIDFLIVDESTAGIRPWNLLSSLVNYMLTHGVPSQTVMLLLMLPIIATILAFLKQVIGVTTFGLYTPSIVALSLLALGWWVGLFFLLFILITGYATRTFMRRWRLLYIPKVAIIIVVVSLTLLLLLGLGALFGVTLSGDTIFVLLIMSTLAESFLNVKTEEGLWSAVVGVAETILAAVLCVFIVKWPPLQSFVIAYPELILLTLLVNIILGRFTGLRLVEYVRFREVFKNMQAEE